MTELQQVKIAEAVQQILCCIEPHSHNREGLRETSDRVARAYKEMLSGYSEDPKEHFKVFEEGKCDEMVIVKDIEFFSMCEHHLLPFFGVAHIGYLPYKQVIGLSKIPRVVECFAKRLQLQERLTSQVCNCLMVNLAPKGCGVVIEAKHLCMACRGVKKPQAKMVTSSLDGHFKHDPATRAEFLNFIRS